MTRPGIVLVREGAPISTIQERLILGLSLIALRMRHFGLHQGINEINDSVRFHSTHEYNKDDINKDSFQRLWMPILYLSNYPYPVLIWDHILSKTSALNIFILLFNLVVNDSLRSLGQLFTACIRESWPRLCIMENFRSPADHVTWDYRVIPQVMWVLNQPLGKSYRKQGNIEALY